MKEQHVKNMMQLRDVFHQQLEYYKKLNQEMLDRPKIEDACSIEPDMQGDQQPK